MGKIGYKRRVKLTYERRMGHKKPKRYKPGGV